MVEEIDSFQRKTLANEIDVSLQKINNNIRGVDPIGDEDTSKSLGW
ncbi:MAG: hypothetical protein NY202_02540 [Mollicutes bacterium UO1]